MSFWENVKKSTAEYSQRLSDEVSKYKNAKFLTSVVTGCAFMAMADGTVSAPEKQKMIGFLKNSAELKVFKFEEVIAAFNEAVGLFEFDFELGKIEALKRIGRMRDNPDAARIVVRVVIAIGNSDGNFDAKEIKVAEEITKELGLNPSDFLS